MTFRAVMAEADLWEGEFGACEVAGTRILLVKLDGQVRAFEDRCAHLGVALSEGTLEGNVLTCRAHHYQYDATSGRGINPACVHLRGYPVEIRDGMIWVEIERSCE
jgi:toluene monooxygenase system ferredoxin subunit